MKKKSIKGKLKGRVGDFFQETFFVVDAGWKSLHNLIAITLLSGLNVLESNTLIFLTRFAHCKMHKSESFTDFAQIYSKNKQMHFIIW